MYTTNTDKILKQNKRNTIQTETVEIFSQIKNSLTVLPYLLLLLFFLITPGISMR